MIEIDRAKQLLAEKFGHADFLAGQEESLGAILSGRNLLVVMPTGSGKSLLYQLPALMQDGLTIVVSPLISLMKDQVDDLERRGIAATFVNSSLSLSEQQSRLNLCACNSIKLLYVAPERFRNKHFIEALRNATISRIAIDEAHCISEWGHDFRPDYLRLKEFRTRMGSPSITALTATATPKVRQDIIESLGLEPDDVDVHVRGFDRPNLILSVQEFSARDRKDEFVLRYVREHEGSTIIYTSTRGDAEKLGDALKAVEPRTAVYHAGLEADTRARFQDRFMSGKDRVVAATNAFGMGIDKADIRSVIHYNYPASIEQYYQEIGRAGRDGKTSHCVLLHSLSDRGLREFFIGLNYPGPDLVKRVYEELFSIDENPVMLTYKEIAARCGPKVKDGHVSVAVRLLDGAGITKALSGEPKVAIILNKPASKVRAKLRGPVQIQVLEGLSATGDIEKPGRFEASLHQLSRASGLSEDQIRRALRVMSSDGVIEYEPPFRGRGVEKLANPPPFDKAQIDWNRQMLLRGAENQKLEEMEQYINCDGCRREFILRYFGEKESFRCGTCDRCNPTMNVTGKCVVLTEHPKIAKAILLCIRHLSFPLGATKVIEIITGARSKDLIKWDLQRNPVYGLAPADKKTIKKVLDDLVTERYLKRAGQPDRPVLALTMQGRDAVSSMSVNDLSARKSPSSPKPPPRLQQPENDHAKLTPDEENIVAAVLRCINGLGRRRGAKGITEVLTGSKAKWIEPAGADKLEVYGCLDVSREHIKRIIGSMLQEELLRNAGNDFYPVLELTGAGRVELERLTGEAEPPMSDEADDNGEELVEMKAEPLEAQPSNDAGGLLDHAILELLHSPADRAKTILPELRLFHPKELAQRLFQAFQTHQEDRAHARVVWVLGELCGQYALSFLVDCASSDEANIRQLAASALGKIAKGVYSDGRSIAPDMMRARESLVRLTRDLETQVRQYAENSLREFPD
ncbi:RecQ family ATP-dependent DNA helicase [bacterium]|nr:RecQ family ATP-dependent DNA helicase [bacterium]